MKKMAFIPSDQQQSLNIPQYSDSPMTSQQAEVAEKKKKSTNSSPTDKVNRIVKIVLKLAKINAYDEEARIVSRNGYAIERSSLISLLNHCMTVGHALYRESEFIELLKLAKVDPDLIINENVKSKLSQTYEMPMQVKTTPSRVVVPEREEEPSQNRPVKRQLSEDESVIEDWELPRKRFHEDASA